MCLLVCNASPAHPTFTGHLHGLFRRIRRCQELKAFKNTKSKHYESATTFMSTACCRAWCSLIIESSSHKLKFSFRYLWDNWPKLSSTHPDLKISTLLERIEVEPLVLHDNGSEPWRSNLRADLINNLFPRGLFGCQYY